MSVPPAARTNDTSAALLMPGVAVLAAGLLPTLANGLFSVTDLLLLALLPVTWSRARHVRALRTLVVLCGLWLASQVASNLVNDVPMDALVDGIWQPTVLAASSVGIFWFTNGAPRRVAVLLATGLGFLLAYGTMVVTSAGSTDPWKYQFGIPATLLAGLAIGFLWRARRTTASVAATAALGCVNIVLGFRSLGGICIVGAALLLLLPMLRQASVWRIALTILAGAAASFAITSAYGALALSGHLGYAQQEKYIAQSSTQANLLIAARPEALISLKSIQRHPFLGIGSTAELDNTATDQALAALAAAGVELSPLHYERLLGDGLNSHSLALGAWVQAGMIGVLPWLYLVYLGIRSCFGAASPRWAFLRPITVIWTLVCMWDFLFSPWSPHYQILLGSFATLVAAQLPGTTDEPQEPRLAGVDAIPAATSR
jgi:hypothetical protein